MGASYLTGAPRADYSDTDSSNYLGRLGTFIITLYKNSTLAKSPHLTPSRVESYDDYDADFKSILVRLQQSQASARVALAEEQAKLLNTTPEEVLSKLRAAFQVKPSGQLRPN